MDSNEKTLSSDRAYFEDSYLFEFESFVDSVENDGKDDEAVVVTIEKTIFHPQGGGQPSDEGVLLLNDKEVKVLGVSIDREKDRVLHKISKHEQVKVGDKVKMVINQEKRQQYARLHSGGHLLDIAVSKLKLDLIPSKGYHFAEGPYVEYKGKLDNMDSYKEKFETISNEVIDENGEEAVFVKIFDYEEAKKQFEVPDYMPKDKPVRWVKLTRDDTGCPCGGTHVKKLKDIGKLKVTKIIKKKDVIRVSYQVV